MFVLSFLGFAFTFNIALTVTGVEDFFNSYGK